VLGAAAILMMPPAVMAPATDLLNESFSGCTVGTNINGYNGWSGSSPDLNDLAICDVGDWNGELLTKHLSISGRGPPGAWAAATFTAPSAAYDARVKIKVSTNTGVLENWRLFELTGVAKVMFDDNDCQLDVTNGTSLAMDVYNMGCGNHRIVVVNLSSATANTYTLTVLDLDAVQLFQGTYNAASTSAPTEIWLGNRFSGDGISTVRSVLVRDGV
jgi:hypothetical protein